jgi:hypothetical protein
MAVGVVRCDFDASVFFCLTADGSTSYRFLDQLPAALGVAPEKLERVSALTQELQRLRPLVDEMRNSGMLDHADEMQEDLDRVRRQRADILAKHVVQAPAPGAARASAQAWDAQRVATKLRTAHCCVLDGFLSAEHAAALRAHLSSMKESGRLQPGTMTGGLSRSTRGDLMAWVPTSGTVAPALQTLLAAVDELMGALGRTTDLSDELGSDRLVRNEVTRPPATIPRPLGLWPR